MVNGSLEVSRPFFRLNKNDDTNNAWAVCLDGTLHIWDTSSNFARPKYSCENAHPKNTETTGVAFSRDGLRVATRGGDDTVKRQCPCLLIKHHSYLLV